MLRYTIPLLVGAVFGVPAALRAQQVFSPGEMPESAVSVPGESPDDLPFVTQTPSYGGPPRSLGDFTTAPGFGFEPVERQTAYLPAMGWLGLRHSHTHGRHIGRGGPLVGSSWLNRPYYIGGELGPIWLTRPVYDNVTTDADLFGGLFLGWDRDPYWGAELRFDWATPELINRDAPDANRTDSLFMWSYGLLYYPWGDATWRPYWRAGIGNMNYDFPLEDGSRHDQWVLAFPIGVGVKYPIRRWLAARAEVTDHIGVGHGLLNSQNNITLTFGLEWHFGAHPPSYWPWQPSRHIW